MNNHLRTFDDYELFLYTLTDCYPLSITRSTLVLVRIGATLARVTGDVWFTHGFRLSVRERLSGDRLPLVIVSYGYEVWGGPDKLYWYDSQPHPDDPALQSTQPHHKHVPPDMKHHRIPSPEMSFNEANLPFLLEEIEQLLQTSNLYLQ